MDFIVKHAVSYHLTNIRSVYMQFTSYVNDNPPKQLVSSVGIVPSGKSVEQITT